MSREGELIYLHSVLADLDGKKRGQLGRTPGETLILRKYYQHEYDKVSKQIRLLGQEGKIEELEAAYKYSQTPGAAKSHQRRIMLIMAGRATGGSRETYLPLPPDVAAKRVLERAKADRSATQRELQELCNRDAEWNLLLQKANADANRESRQQAASSQNRKAKALSSFDELAGRLMFEVRARRTDTGRLPSAELDTVLRALDKAGFKPLDHLPPRWRNQLSEWNQKNSRKNGAIQTFLAAAQNARFRRGVSKRLYEAEKKYRLAHFPLSTT